MNKHICILICFNNLEHIKQCYESLYNKNIDFFIIENYSDNSEKIKEFFIDKNIIGYIQFEKNISHKAVSTFITDYENILNKYDYITFSDCDLTVENSEKTFQEIIKNLEFSNVIISCVDLTMTNLPKIPGSSSWVPAPLNITDDYIEGASGVHLMTLKNENLWLVKNTTFLDSNIRTSVYSKKKKWVKTIKNKAYHLTWDLYFEGSDYYKYKLTNTDIWNHNNVCDYKIIK
jgi:hypothetical protein